MKAPISWLKEYVDINVDINTLCQKMVDIGLEIEEVDYLGSHINKIVIGQITAIVQHPNADRLRCCTVDIGEEELIPIVTNDTIVEVGDKVPVALDGAKLFDGTSIKKGKMRGELSMGMFCGLEELGIDKYWYPTTREDGVLVLSSDAKVGQNIIGEVGLDDYVIDVCVTSNRQDCNSIYGLAREVGVAIGMPVAKLQSEYKTNSSSTADFVNVSVVENEKCPNYYMQGVENITITESPIWLTRRLSKVGIKCINNIVDITNYVLFEVGQPLHAFDYRDISGNNIVIRNANKGEQITTLDGKENNLHEDNLVIASDNTAIALAGIMGGANSGVKANTNTILIESARFARESVRHTSKQLNVRSDSSARFEKGIDISTTTAGLDRALYWIDSLGFGSVMSNRIDASTAEYQDVVIDMPKSCVKRLLGIEIDTAQIIKILTDLQFSVVDNGNTLTCTVPSFRDDVTRDCDLVEEIIRVYGYDNIVGTLMSNSHITRGGKNEFNVWCDNIKSMLVNRSFNECIFYPFGGKQLFDKLTTNKGYDCSGNIKLLNPLGDELSLMNTSMLPNMLQCAGNNHSHKNTDLKLFEIGKIYLPKSLPLTELPIENNRLTIFASNVSFESFKSDILAVLSLTHKDINLVRSSEKYLHPGISADAYVDSKVVCSLGAVHPVIAENFGLTAESFVTDIDLDLLKSLVDNTFKFANISRYPTVSRDFAVVVDEDVAVQEMLNAITECHKLCLTAKLFDIFRSESVGDGKKSVAVTVTLGDNDKTLSDKEIDKCVNIILTTMSNKFGGVLR